MDNYQTTCGCACGRCRTRGLMGPAVLITMGVLFLLSEFDVVRFHSTWPIILIVIGLVKVLTSSASSEGHTDYAVNPPGPVPPPPAVPAPTDPSEEKQVDHV